MQDIEKELVIKEVKTCDNCKHHGDPNLCNATRLCEAGATAWELKCA